MFAGLGLAALPSGYDAAAINYWKRRAAEDEQAALTALGNYGMQNMPQASIPQPIPTGGPQPQPPQPGPGPVPGMPPPAGGGQPNAALLGAGGPATAGGPGPMAGGPPPGFTNPLIGPGGQPQNLTGPIIPPGGFGGAPAGAPPGGAAGPPGAAPGGPPQRPQQIPPTLLQTAGPPPPGGYDWRQIVPAIAQANPNASPAVIARAAMMLQPFLSQQSQQELRLLNMQLAQERYSLNVEREDRMRSEGATRYGQAEERIQLAREREERLAASSKERIDIARSRAAETERHNYETERARAEALVSRQSKEERDEERKRLETAQTNWHRAVREQIGAEGITNREEKKALLDELKEREAADKAEIDRIYAARRTRPAGGSTRSPAGGTTPPGAGAGTPPPGASFNDRFTGEGGGGGGPALKPIPPADLPGLRQRAQKDPEAVRNFLIERGYDPSGL